MAKNENIIPVDVKLRAQRIKAEVAAWVKENKAAELARLHYNRRPISTWNHGDRMRFAGSYISSCADFNLTEDEQRLMCGALMSAMDWSDDASLTQEEREKRRAKRKKEERERQRKMLKEMQDKSSEAQVMRLDANGKWK